MYQLNKLELLDEFVLTCLKRLPSRYLSLQGKTQMEESHN